jgi:hypothetical protein
MSNCNCGNQQFINRSAKRKQAPPGEPARTSYANLQQLAHHISVGGKLDIMGRNEEAQLN